MTYIYRWDRQGRKGQPCEVLARGKMNSCLVRFPDDYTMVTSRNAIRRAKGCTFPTCNLDLSKHDFCRPECL